MDNSKIDEFEYPKGLFTCSTTDGLKMIESPAVSFIELIKVNDKAFFTIAIYLKWLKLNFKSCWKKTGKYLRKL